MNYKLVLKFLRMIAEERADAHANQLSSRPLSDGYEFVGLVGEYAFGRKYGLPIDLSLKPMGDGRIDFRLPDITIDVKTARKAYNLLREINKPHADILVLAQYYDQPPYIKFFGWEYDTEMLKCPQKDFGYGITNYYKPHDQLRKMEELEQIIKEEKEKI